MPHFFLIVTQHTALKHFSTWNCIKWFVSEVDITAKEKVQPV